MAPPCAGERGAILPSQRTEHRFHCTARFQATDEHHRGGGPWLCPQRTGEREAERLLPRDSRTKPGDGQRPEPGIHAQAEREPGGQHLEGLQRILEVHRLRGDRCL
ncbi:hypothetical protein JJE73_23160 [Comamonas sp. JC664]|nr:hypothetical protein [Comamonas sp. JC664]